MSAARMKVAAACSVEAREGTEAYSTATRRQTQAVPRPVTTLESRKSTSEAPFAENTRTPTVAAPTSAAAVATNALLDTSRREAPCMSAAAMSITESARVEAMYMAKVVPALVRMSASMRVVLS